MNRTSIGPDDPKAISRIEGMSVCIAAYNEATTVGRLLEQLINEPDSGVREVLVCANGCTDGTESVVREFVRRDPRFRLIVQSRGKPAAWNTLMREARSELCLFLDADVVLAPGFFAALSHQVERNPGAAIIAARELPRAGRAGAGALLAALASRSFGFDYVCGCAYALRCGLLRDALAELPAPSPVGCPQMPPYVLPDDLWLEVVAGRSRIAFAPAARVHHDPGTVSDVMKSRARLRVARDQVAAMLPDAFARWQAERTPSQSVIGRLRHRIGTMDGPADVLACTVGTIIRLLIVTVCKRRIGQFEQRMRNQMVRQGGQEVLSGSGRLSKGERG
jgi:glycosyltransferase involved in cell wall biosynthesis